VVWAFLDFLTTSTQLNLLSSNAIFMIVASHFEIYGHTTIMEWSTKFHPLCLVSLSTLRRRHPTLTGLVASLNMQPLENFLIIDKDHLYCNLLPLSSQPPCLLIALNLGDICRICIYLYLETCTHMFPALLLYGMTSVTRLVGHLWNAKSANPLLNLSSFALNNSGFHPMS